MLPSGSSNYDPHNSLSIPVPLTYPSRTTSHAGQSFSRAPAAAEYPSVRPTQPHSTQDHPYQPSYRPARPYPQQYTYTPSALGNLQSARLAQQSIASAHARYQQQSQPPLQLARSRPPPLASDHPSRSSSVASTLSQPRSDSTTSSADHFASRDFARADSPPTDCQLRARRYWRPLLDSMSNTDYAHRVQAEYDLTSLTVDKLKIVIRSINSRLSLHLRVSGKKNELYTALIQQLAEEYGRPDKARFHLMRAIISTAKTGAAQPLPTRTTYDGGYANHGASTSAGVGAISPYGSNGYGGMTSGTSTPAYGSGGWSGTATATRPGQSTSAMTNNLPPPRFGGAGAYGTGVAAAAASGMGVGGYGRVGDDIPIRFRPSPFFRIEKFVSPVVALPRAAPGDRKSAVCNITLTEAQRTLLIKSKEAPGNPQYQIRLYCTSDTNFNQMRAQANQFPAPVEYPPTCEVKLNGITMPVNTKGIKKQPGTAPPVNLTAKTGPALVLTPGAPNRAEVIYINTDKTFYLVAYLVEYTSVDKVVNRVKSGKTKAKEEVIQSIIALNSDEDVEASALGLSLRDPLSFMRIEVPIRSAHCEHIACFDAMTWFEVNEQTPQWQCPICSKTLKVDDMVVDEYFEDILRVCSSAVDSVTVEPDGTWRSDNDKYGTAKPRSTVASAAPSGRNTPVGAGTDREGANGGSGTGASDKGKQRASTELVLSDDDDPDDEDDDMPLAKRRRLGSSATGTATGGSSTPFGGSAGGGGGGGGGARRREVVDLTLSSDDEDAVEPPPPPAAVPAKLDSSATPAATAATTALAPAGAADESVPDPIAAAAATSLPTAPEPTRQLSDHKAAAQVDQDIRDMHDRMVRDYGPNWKEQFGY